MIFDNHEIQFNVYNKRTLFTEANNHTFNYRTILTPGTSFQYSFTSGDKEDLIKNKISTGADLQWQNIKENSVDNIYALPGDTVRSKEEINQSGVGLFVLDQVSIGNKTNIFLSLRYDKIHNELNDLF